MFAYAIKHQDYVSRNPRHPNPVKPIDKLPEPDWEITFLSLDQVHCQLVALESYVLERLPDKHPNVTPRSPGLIHVLQPMVAMLIYAGLRREEILWLTKQDVDLHNRLIRIYSKTIKGEYWQPKNRKNRVIPISNSLLKYLENYEPNTSSPWFFPSPSGLQWDTENFSRAIRNVNRLTELVWTENDPHAGKKAGATWSCNDFRHTFGSQLAMRGHSLYKISELMGNSPEVCRKHYAHLMPESLRECVEFDKPTDHSLLPQLRIIEREDSEEIGKPVMPAG